MRVIVGLHNPERAYAGTRHNVGAEVVTLLARRNGARFRRGPRGVRCRVARVVIESSQTLLVLPQTSMNVCGPPVRAAAAYYKADPSDLLVLHDDIDLPFGRLRLHEGRGHGGHNGVRSVMQALGTPGFWRLKVGVGRPPGRMNPADFVLSRFFAEERPEVLSMVQDAAVVVETFMEDPERAVALAGGRRPAEPGRTDRR